MINGRGGCEGTTLCGQGELCQFMTVISNIIRESLSIDRSPLPISLRFLSAHRSPKTKPGGEWLENIASLNEAHIPHRPQHVPPPPHLCSVMSIDRSIVLVIGPSRSISNSIYHHRQLSLFLTLFISLSLCRSLSLAQCLCLLHFPHLSLSISALPAPSNSIGHVFAFLFPLNSSYFVIIYSIYFILATSLSLSLNRKQTASLR